MGLGVSMQTVDVNEARKIVHEKESVVIDALGPESFRRQHLPGALNIPSDDADLDGKIRDKVPSKDTRVLVYCSDPECQASPKVYRRLKELGYSDVHEFSGGLKAWAEAGLDFEGEGKKRIEADVER